MTVEYLTNSSLFKILVSPKNVNFTHPHVTLKNKMTFFLPWKTNMLVTDSFPCNYNDEDED